jgi:hypothetical protein
MLGRMDGKSFMTTTSFTLCNVIWLNSVFEKSQKALDFSTF